MEKLSPASIEVRKGGVQLSAADFLSSGRHQAAPASVGEARLQSQVDRQAPSTGQGHGHHRDQQVESGTNIVITNN